MPSTWYTTNSTTEPTGGHVHRYYIGTDSARVDDGRYTHTIIDEFWEEPKKKKLTDIIGEPDWII